MPLPSPATVPVMIRLDQTLGHRPDLIFDAYADMDRRARWIVPTDETVVFESHDFRVGGTDHFIRDLGGNNSVVGTTRYEHIVANECIVFTERLIDSHHQLQIISLVTWTITPAATGALLAIADQTTSVVGSRPIEGRKYRHRAMLDRLAEHLAHSFD